jgi:5-methylcytosine-specific restriction endonuclease McrA
MTTQPAPNSTRIPGSVRRAVIERDGRTCQACGRPVVVNSRRSRRSRDHRNMLTLDHIVAISNGGGSTADNLRVCCRECNMRRSARPLVLDQ